MNKSLEVKSGDRVFGFSVLYGGAVRKQKTRQKKGKKKKAYENKGEGGGIGGITQSSGVSTTHGEEESVTHRKKQGEKEILSFPSVDERKKNLGVGGRTAWKTKVLIGTSMDEKEFTWAWSGKRRSELFFSFRGKRRFAEHRR